MTEERKAAITALSVAIYSRLPNKYPVTEANVSGNMNTINQAIDLSLLFFKALDQRLQDAEVITYERP